MQKNRLLIVDGNNLLFQMFYGIPAKIYNKRGRTIHATLGFVSALQKMIKTYQINGCIVVFDRDCAEERKQAFDRYKANRDTDWESLPADEVPFLEEEYIKECLQYLGVCALDSCHMEADDLIASIALRERGDNQVFISSYDSDFFQLINDNVKVIRYRGDCSVVCDEDYVMSKFATHPALYADAKALFGDSADNIRGIQGVGPKTAAKIVNSLGHVEDILSSTDKIENSKIRKGIEENIEIIKRNISLIRLDSHVPLPFSLEQMKLSPNLPKTMDVISKIDL